MAKAPTPKTPPEILTPSALRAALTAALSMLSDRQVDELERRHKVVSVLRQAATGVGANRI